MKHIIVGTAGHVDHGKTMLVKALTGQDTDRLKEEKQRGISIELGFAPLSLPSGKRVAIIDVPGHERFVKNMLAGVGGIDLVLLVIAADEGVMPQTREHLHIIDLLHIPDGIIVLTKADLVDEEWLQLVQEEVREAMSGSVLAEAPMVTVSSQTKQGFDQLLNLLDEAVSQVKEKPASGILRMPIDRIFSKTGFGTVVTGTLVSGVITVGDLLEILPENLEGRVRSLQVHGQKVEQAFAGQRVAVNISGIEVDDFHRGSVLVHPGTFEPSYRVDVLLELLADAEKKLENRKRIRFHLGTKESLGRVVLLDRDELEPGEKAFAQITLEEPIITARKDRFVIRSYSPMVTIGGGEIIDANPPKHKRFIPEIIENLKTKQKGTPEDLLLQQLAGDHSQLVLLEEAGANVGLTVDAARQAAEQLAAKGLVEQIYGDGKDFVVAKAVLNNWENNIRTALDKFHQNFPLRLGLAKEELRSRYFSAITNKVFNVLLEYWRSKGMLKVLDQVVALQEFEPRPDNQTADLLAELEAQFQTGKFQPPSWKESIERLQATSLADELLQYLILTGKLIKVDNDMYFHTQAVEEAIKILRQFLQENKELQLGEARDLLGSSRKYVLPLLEYMDRNRITRRVGDKRVAF